MGVLFLLFLYMFTYLLCKLNKIYDQTYILKSFHVLNSGLWKYYKTLGDFSHILLLKHTSSLNFEVIIQKSITQWDKALNSTIISIFIQITEWDKKFWPHFGKICEFLFTSGNLKNTNFIYFSTNIEKCGSMREGVT